VIWLALLESRKWIALPTSAALVRRNLLRYGLRKPDHSVFDSGVYGHARLAAQRHSRCDRYDRAASGGDHMRHDGVSRMHDAIEARANDLLPELRTRLVEWKTLCPKVICSACDIHQSVDAAILIDH